MRKNKNARDSHTTDCTDEKKNTRTKNQQATDKKREDEDSRDLLEPSNEGGHIPYTPGKYREEYGNENSGRHRKTTKKSHKTK